MTTLCRLRLLLPVKPLHLAKSRLDVPPGARRAVAEGLFARTLGIALKCLSSEQVFVVASDPEVRRLALQVGVETLPDPDVDLNASLEAGVLELRRRSPHATVAILVADLPRLTPRMLRRLLLDCEPSVRARHVVDHRGTGTTFVSIPAGVYTPLFFGPGSAARFQAAGSVPVLAPVGVAHDLDFLEDLDSLHRRGCGAGGLSRARPELAISGSRR